MQEALGISDENVFKAASGLHGGMSRGDVCGSLLGSSLMIGLVCGESVEESAKQKAYSGPPDWGASSRLVGEIYDWFGQEFGSVKCEIVRGKHEQEAIAEAGGQSLTDEEKMDRFHAKCDELCAKTAAKTVELLWDELKK